MNKFRSIKSFSAFARPFLTQSKFSFKRFTTSAPKSKGFWKTYNELLQSHPLLTKAVTSGFLSFTADILCQFALAFDTVTKEDLFSFIDWHRVGKFTFLGTFLVAPSLHYWYGFLARKIPGTNFAGVVKRLMLDQLVFAPCFLTSFFSSALLIDGKGDQIVTKLKNDLPGTVLANYMVWVPAMTLNFGFVPPHLQVLFSNGVGFFWNIYLSFATFKEHPSPPPSSSTPSPSIESQPSQSN